MPHIRHFSDINGYNLATAFPEKTHLDEFYILRMDDSGDHFARVMPPHTIGFFQIGFQYRIIETAFSLQTRQFTSLENLLYMVAPGQVMSWVIDAQNSGFILYFKREFLAGMVPDIEQQFPFLRIAETSLFQLPAETAGDFYDKMVEMRAVFEQKHPFHEEMLRGMLYTFLFRCKQVYESGQKNAGTQPKNIRIANRFQELVGKFFIEKKTVEAYAEMLNLTPNHLSAVVKSATNRTAKSIIQERLLLEAKNLLRYTSADIAQIAYDLQFEAPQHFGRFFKQATDMTPGEFRQKTKS